MVRARHTLALALLVSGCWSSHGRGIGGGEEDAGPPPLCADEQVLVGDFLSLDCPRTALVGQRVSVQVEHFAGGCCSENQASIGVTDTGGGSWALTSSWQVCDCCESCPCVGPTFAEEVSIGPVVAGPNVVQAGAFVCVIEGLATSGCAPAPSSVLAPRVLLPQQRFSATLVHEATADCGCTPELLRGDVDVQLSLCSCSDACDAVLTSYAGSFVEGTPPAPGVVSYMLAGERHEVRVMEPGPFPGAGCAPIEPTSMRVIEPPLATDGPRLWWVEIQATQPLCCSPDGPLLGGVEISSEPGTIAVDPLTCTLEDCFCGNPVPTPGVAYHSLGELPPGEYRVQVGDLAETITVR